MAQTLRHLRQKYATDAALIEQREQFIQRLNRESFNVVTAAVCDLARGLVGGHAFCKTSQILDQHHAQRGGQRPHFA